MGNKRYLTKDNLTANNCMKKYSTPCHRDNMAEIIQAYSMAKVKHSQNLILTNTCNRKPFIHC